MTFLGWLTIFLFAAILDGARVARSGATWRRSIRASTCSSIRPGCPERLLYRIMRVDPDKGQDWKAYAKSLIIFSLAGWLLLYFILRTQTLWNFTGLNPRAFTRRRGT